MNLHSVNFLMLTEGSPTFNTQCATSLQGSSYTTSLMKTGLRSCSKFSHGHHMPNVSDEADVFMIQNRTSLRFLCASRLCGLCSAGNRLQPAVYSHRTSPMLTAVTVSFLAKGFSRKDAVWTNASSRLTCCLSNRASNPPNVGHGSLAVTARPDFSSHKACAGNALLSGAAFKSERY